MNERIKELAILSGYLKLPKLEIRRGPYRGMCGGNDVYDAPYYPVKEVEAYKNAVKKFTDEQLEKFAELIIQECAEVASLADAVNEDYSAWYLIEKHFEMLGVNNDTTV